MMAEGSQSLSSVRLWSATEAFQSVGTQRTIIHTNRETSGELVRVNWGGWPSKTLCDGSSRTFWADTAVMGEFQHQNRHWPKTRLTFQKTHLKESVLDRREKRTHLKNDVLFYQKMNIIATIRHGGGRVMVWAWKPATAGYQRFIVAVVVSSDYFCHSKQFDDLKHESLT